MPLRLLVRPLFRLLVVLCLLASTARADDLTDAKLHYQLGVSAYEKGAFADAIREFQASYSLSKRPAILFNLARAEGQLGHDQAAIDYLKHYLQDAPDASDAPSLRAEIVARQHAIDEGRAKVKAQAEAARDRQRAQDAEAREAAAEAARARATPPPAVRPRWPGWLLLGTGAVLVAGGIAAGVIAQNAASTLMAEGQPGLPVTFDHGKQSQGKTAATAGLICDVAGAAFAGAGVGLLVWAARKPESQTRAWIAPSLNGLVAGGRF